MMASTIAWQIADDFEAMIDDCEFYSAEESNEWYLDKIQTACVDEEHSKTTSTYIFKDGSKISVNGHYYIVGGV